MFSAASGWIEDDVGDAQLLLEHPALELGPGETDLVRPCEGA
jgi:hypothetical protein